MRAALSLLLLNALASSLEALEHDYFASYYGNEGQANAANHKLEEPPDGVRRQDSWPPPDSNSGPPSSYGDPPDPKYGGEEIYWGPNPPPLKGGGHYGYPSHYPMTTTTKAPPPKDMGQRVSKKPYSYYFLGRKLWYIPLYFAIYYTVYVGALIIKAIARHRINLPAGYGRESGSVGLADMVGKAIHEFGQKYM
ncbi:uncharacterized protein LOC124153703 [Ischnura elegans]|uniref:uncharacterized protein LOC124153703 n=1 Tax=Ischnura elegans TaxID=197161 RepID=UPI001ED89FA4|nr:uncharacterized protein LOC124153703 [Ischnura elegans]